VGNAIYDIVVSDGVQLYCMSFTVFPLLSISYVCLVLQTTIAAEHSILFIHLKTFLDRMPSDQVFHLYFVQPELNEKFSPFFKEV
jgi:hypothetical protein